jgi:hypothetical protein
MSPKVFGLRVIHTGNVCFKMPHLCDETNIEPKVDKALQPV